MGTRPGCGVWCVQSASVCVLCASSCARVWQPRNQPSDLIVAATSAGDNTFCCVDHTPPSRLYRLLWLVRVDLVLGLCHRREDSLIQLAGFARPPVRLPGFGRPVPVVHAARLTTHITQPAAQNPEADAGSAGDGLIMHASPHPAYQAQPRPRFFSSFSLPCVGLSHLACVA